MIYDCFPSLFSHFHENPMNIRYVTAKQPCLEPISAAAFVLPAPARGDTPPLIPLMPDPRETSSAAPFSQI